MKDEGGGGMTTDMTDPTSTRRWFCPTPGWLILGLLVVECLLWLSERFRWFCFNDHKGWTVLIAVAVGRRGDAAHAALVHRRLLFRWRFQFLSGRCWCWSLAVALPCSWLAVEMKKAKEQKDGIGGK